MSNSDAEADVFLTPHELVDRYKGTITPRTLANWRSSGDGPTYRKIGGRVLYVLREVRLWEESRRFIKRVAAFLPLADSSSWVVVEAMVA